MFIKLLISLIILTSSGIIGYLLAYHYGQRVQELKDLYVYLQLLETEIMYTSNSLPLALNKIGNKGNKTVSRFFLDTYDLLILRSGFSFEEAWSKAVEKNFQKTSLNKEDKDILLDFGMALGDSDRENQIKNFQYMYLQLRKHQDSAELLRFKNEKMYKSLGILVGLAIVIVFI